MVSGQALAEGARPSGLNSQYLEKVEVPNRYYGGLSLHRNLRMMFQIMLLLVPNNIQEDVSTLD